MAGLIFHVSNDITKENSMSKQDYSGKCPICGKPFLEGELDDGLVEVTEPWADGYGECCAGTPEAEAISKALKEK